jgi:hypothetical protein
VVITVLAIIGIKAASDDAAAVDTAAAQPNGGDAPVNGFGPGGFPGGGGVTIGEIQSVDGSSITVKDQSGQTTKVATTDATRVTSTETGTVGDLKVGDNVSVSGSGAAAQLSADRVTDSGDVPATAGFGSGRGGFAGQGDPSSGRAAYGGVPANRGGQSPGEGQVPSGVGAPNGQAPNGRERPNGSGQFTPPTFVVGTIASIDESTITVRTTSGTSTVTLSDSTVISTVTTIAVSDLEVGESVLATGEAKDGAMTATSITSGEVGFGFGGGRQRGPGGSVPSTTVN